MKWTNKHLALPATLGLCLSACPPAAPPQASSPQAPVASPPALSGPAPAAPAASSAPAASGFSPHQAEAPPASSIKADPFDPSQHPDVVLRGCQIVLGKPVLFDTDKSTLRPESFDILAQFAAFLRQHPDIEIVRIEGHTDNRGASLYGRDLSRERAQAVRRWLIAEGRVEATTLQAVGYGATRPIADNRTAEGRHFNRRIEARLVGSGC